MSWNDFGERLQRALREVTDRSVLIVAAAAELGAGYVQFIGVDDLLVAEASGPEFVTGVATHTAEQPIMLAAGWVAPTRPQPNWSFDLALPALTSEYAELAGRCVTALRDVFGIAEPEVLTYRAWREPEQQPPGVTWPPERFDQLDPGENPLILPSLGLRQVV